MKQSGTSASAAMLVGAWAVPPLYYSLKVKCKNTVTANYGESPFLVWKVLQTALHDIVTYF